MTVDRQHVISSREIRYRITIKTQRNFLKIRNVNNPDWLTPLLKDPTGIQRVEYSMSGLEIQQPLSGVIEFIPSKPFNHSILISAGIHGNETAPIELINKLIGDIVNGRQAVSCHLICVLGNPPSVATNQRFIETNLNRLFSGAHKHYKHCDETKRAFQLEELLAQTWGSTALSLTHYDLHTAIRRSEFEKFAVCPFGQPLDAGAMHLLDCCDIEAVLESHKPATTFSYFTSNQFNAHSFTLELGKAAPFGQNKGLNLKKIEQHLRNHIEDKWRPTESPLPSGVRRFRVVHELIRTSEKFNLHIEDDAPNFSHIPRGQLVASDRGHEYRPRLTDERVVFPNPNVPVGQRAGLVVVSDS